jgi:tetratricopeptide (TPR) repeat protein
MLLLIAMPQGQAASNDNQGTIAALKKEGTLLRLKGDYGGANRISARLKHLFPEQGIGYTMNLNTLVTRLSWDDQQSQYDEPILRDSKKTLSLCHAQIKAHPDDYQGYYDCGQAHFALTYLHALRGNYYRAGTNGSNTIENLEQTLKLNPNLIDAKMHLGIAYYYADNLPPFVKAFSRYLWFIPSGNSDKSLPYIKEVTEKGEFFKDVAKFLYSDLLIGGDDNDRQQAKNILGKLTVAYPENRRFQFRYIALLGELGEFDESMDSASQFIATEQKYNRDQEDITLVRLWTTRAHLGLKDLEGAIDAFSKINQSSVDDEFPSWGRSWFMLTRAQIQDLQNKRAQALADYQRVIEMFSDYASTEVLAAARAGLKTPFSLALLP